jgi:HPt (histidine-containing phosphotransfer) domain-containing protein
MLLDINVLANIADENIDVQNNILRNYMDQVTETIHKIHEACSIKSVDKVRRLTHMLKSSSRSVGANHLAGILVKVELQVRRGLGSDIIV